MLRFHGAAIELLPAQPAFSRANADTVAKREAQIGRKLPAAVREWYCLDQCVDVLREHSNCDQPVPLEQLGAAADDWYGAGPRDFLQGDLLWIMTENQGVCNWAVRLDGSDDPPVVVEVDSAPNEVWLPLASSFSEFIFCQIWDHPQNFGQCCAQEADLTENDWQYLQNKFVAGPKTTAWPGTVNLRFHSADGRILIWYAEDHGADWFLFAPAEEEMVRLLRNVWSCGDLATTLYARDNVAEQALTRVRTVGG